MLIKPGYFRIHPLYQTSFHSSKIRSRENEIKFIKKFKPSLKNSPLTRNIQMETGSIDPALSDFLTDTDPIVADIFCNDLLMVSFLAKVS